MRVSDRGRRRGRPERTERVQIQLGALLGEPTAGLGPTQSTQQGAVDGPAQLETGGQ